MLQKVNRKYLKTYFDQIEKYKTQSLKSFDITKNSTHYKVIKTSSRDSSYVLSHKLELHILVQTCIQCERQLKTY